MARAAGRDFAPRGPRRYRHLVHVSGCAEERARAAADVLGASFGDGGTAFVMATASQREALGAELTSRGFDVQEARAAGTYVELDAADTLSKVVRCGSPDPVAFDTFVGAPVGRASRRGRPVYICGELVDLLCARGHSSSALAVEGFWSDLADRYKFSLYCGYSLASIAGSGLTTARDICGAHTAVVTPSGYAEGTAESTAEDDEKQRSTVLLPVVLAPRAARGFVVDTLVAWEAPEFADPAALIASELATNAVVHTRAPFELSLSRSGSHLTVSVRDSSHGIPAPVRSTRRRAGGRGLSIVSSISRQWGVDPLADGKVIWAQL